MITFDLFAPAVGLELAAPPALSVGLDVAVSIVGGIPYTGDYEVTPKVYAPVILPTKYKTLADDITVRKIPQYEVSNASGGNTLIMGDEYYG